MKKLLVLLAVVTASASVASAQTWGVGGRLGSGFQAVGQYVFANDNYVEARLGLGLGIGSGWGIGADFTALYVWNVANWDWTPGNWFLDVGAGLNVGGGKNWAYFGVAGMGKFGYTFERIPLSLSVDVTPSFGPDFWYAKGFKTQVGFHSWGLLNFGLSAVYRF